MRGKTERVSTFIILIQMTTMSKKQKVKNAGRTSASTGTKEKSPVLGQCLGIDTSKLTLDLCFSQKKESREVIIKGTRKVNNSKSGFSSIVSYIERFRVADVPFSVVLEYTGVYHEKLAQYLYDAGYSVSIVLPNKSHNYAKSLNIKTKTDKSDAKILAQLGLERELGIWEPCTPNMLSLRSLTREKQQIEDELTTVRNQMEAQKNAQLNLKDTAKRQNQRVALLEKQITAIEGEIKVLVKADEELKQQVSYVQSIRGIGFATAVTLIAETQGFKYVENKSQLVSYAGLDVVKRESGTSVRGRTCISKKGNSHIRKALHFPAMVAVKVEGDMKELYDRVLERNPKIKMKALVAVQRKLLVLAYTLYKNKTTYDPKYIQKQAKVEELA